MVAREMPAMASSSYISTTSNLRDLYGAAAQNAQQWTVEVPVAAVGARATIIPRKQEPPVTTRLVQVFIADPNESVPLDHRLLYRGGQHLTELDDNELFFEISIQDLLKAHNEKRVTFRNKAVKDRAESLEPARIRDLKMTVVTIAAF